MTSDNHLEDANACASLALPQLGVGVEPLKDVKRLRCVVELSHLVAVVSDELEKTERLGRRLHLQVQLPRQTRLPVHYICKTRMYSKSIVLV